MMDRLLKRIPLAMSNNNNNNSSSSFVPPPPPLTLGAVNPLDSARRQLATLEPTVKALLEMKNPALAIVREKLETMEAIIVAFPEELEPVEAAIWRAKMATWWVEYSKQQTAALFPGLEGEKDKDQQQQQQQQQSHDLAPVFFPKPSVADSETDHLASFGGGGAIRRFRSFANERNQAKNLPVTTTTANSSMMAVEDGSTAESSDGEEPDLKRPTLAQSSSSSSAFAAASAKEMPSVADPDSRLIDAGDSKEAGLKAIQFFSKGR